MLQPVSVPGSEAFSWNSVPGFVYQVQYETNLSQSGWMNSGTSINATNTTTGFTNGLGMDSRRFYRIQLQ